MADHVVLLTGFQLLHKIARMNIPFRFSFIATHDNARLNLFDLQLYYQRPCEDWDSRSSLYKGPGRWFMLPGQGGPAQGAPAARAGVPCAARPAQGHKICKGEAFASSSRRPQSAFPFREVQDELQPPSPGRRNAVRGCQNLGIRTCRKTVQKF